MKIFLEAVVCFLWWNPVAYALRDAICALFEFRADREATRHLDNNGKLQYVKLLIRMGRERLQWKNCLYVAGKKNNGSVLLKRAGLILDHTSGKTQKHELAFLSLCIVAVVAAIAMSGIVVLEPDMTPESVENTTFTLSAENAYLVHREGELYDLYVEGELAATLPMHESIAELPVLKVND